MARQMAVRGGLFVKERLPICRNRTCRPGHRLIHRMRVGSVKLRTVEEFFSAVVVKPILPRLEARNDRVPRFGVMLRCMLIWRIVTAADVTAFGASAKMQPPIALSHAFGATRSAWLRRSVDAIPVGFHTPLLVRFLRPGGRRRSPAPGSHVARVFALITSGCHASCRLAVSDARLALPDFDNIAIRIANVAACLAVLLLWLGDKLGPATPP